MKARSRSSSIPKRSSDSRRKGARTAGTWTVRRALAELKRHGERCNVAGMARFGILAKKVWGVSKPQLDELARKIGRNHTLGPSLRETGIHDARLLGMLLSQSHLVTSSQYFDHWDICDGTCCHWFVAAGPAWDKAWTTRKKESQKRAGFALAAYLAIHDKTAPDAPFRKFLKVIEGKAWDARNFVRKTVDWALRNIGKRKVRLNRQAITTAERICRGGTRSGRWVAADALRELKSDAVQTRLLRKGR
jgi:3-methyladenine DNA glycosylase AlkD